jgi:hypothetical protein
LRVIFIGPAPESRGLSLAGVAPEICDTAAAAAAALVSAGRPGSDIGLVLLSASLASEAEVAGALRGLAAPPAVLVLPDPESSAARPEGAE